MDARAHWHDEMQSAWLYRQLSKAEPEARVSALFTELARRGYSQAELEMIASRNILRVMRAAEAYAASVAGAPPIETLINPPAKAE